MNGLQQLHDAGVSIWLDTVSRELLASGGFATLIAPDLVNTMPEATLHAFADHGEAARVLSESTAAAEEVLHRVQDAGVEVAAVTAQLERERVESFCASYHGLIDRIKTKTGGSVVATERPDVLR
jgi:transaldolase